MTISSPQNPVLIMIRLVRSLIDPHRPRALTAVKNSCRSERKRPLSYNSHRNSAWNSLIEPPNAKFKVIGCDDDAK